MAQLVQKREEAFDSLQVETAYQRSMRERVAQAAGSMAHIVAAKPPGQTRPLEPWEEAIENRNQTTAIGMD